VSRFLSLLEAGRRLGGLSSAAVCELVVNHGLRGCLVEGRLMVARADLRNFIASAPLRIVPTHSLEARPVASSGQPNGPEVTP
jgi:hypothetical protein